MTIAEIASYTDAIVKILGLPSLIIIGIVALFQLALKWRSDRIAGDTTLITHFVNLMRIAHARAGNTEDDSTGIAEQDAAIAAIWELGRRYKVLRPAAIQGLATLCQFKPDVARPYFDNLASRSWYGKTPVKTPSAKS